MGSPLSLNALRELGVAHKTVATWIRILERLYAVFRLPPLGVPRIRAVKKEQKHYHFDWSLVPELPQRFENMVGSHLLKWVHFEEDARGRDLELRYFRDTDGREVDFVVTRRSPPAPLGRVQVVRHERRQEPAHLKARFPSAEAWQLVATGAKDFQSPEGIRVCPAGVFLNTFV